MSSKFEYYVKYHRKLLEKGIVEHPKYFKKSDLFEYDKTVLASRKYLIKEGILNEWEPVLYLEHPTQFLTLTEQQILFKTYMEHESGESVLLEQISADIPANVNAAMQSQIRAIKFLRAFYDKLPPEQQTKVDDQTGDRTKSRMDFKEELKDLEDEINGIYGKLQKGGFFSKTAKRGFGLFQRGMGKLFGAGEVGDTRVSYANEQKMFEELFPEQQESILEEQASSVPAVLNAIRGAWQMGKNGSALLPDKALQAIARNFNMTPADVANATHSIGGNVTHRLGTPQGMEAWRQAAQQAASSTSTGAANSGGGAMTSLKGAPKTFMSALKSGGGKGVAAKAAAGLGLGAKLAIGGGIAGLIAAGAAGSKMRNRRKRIETLQIIARENGAKGVAVAPVLAPPSLEQPKTTQTPPTDATSELKGPDEAKPQSTPAPEAKPAVPTPGGEQPSKAESTETGKNNKKDIYVMRGKAGQGFQSRAARAINADQTLKSKAGEHQKAASTVLNALAKDLRATNMFNVLEEGRTQINLPTTLAALDKVTDPKVKEILRNEIVQLLRQNGVMVRSDILKNPGASTVEVNVNTDNKKAKTEDSGTKAPAPAEPVPAAQPTGYETPEETVDSVGRRLQGPLHKNGEEDVLASLDDLKKQLGEGSITLKEYNIRKAKLEKILLKEHIKAIILNKK